MRTSLMTILSSLLLVACSAAPSGVAPGATGVLLPSDDFGLGPTTLPVPGGSDHRPSGARIRLVNAYAPLDGDPGAVQVFSGFAAREGQQPLATVGYEEVTGWFDPGVDSAGNAAMSWYPSGSTAEDDKLGDQTATLTGDERITIFLTTGDRTNPSGARYGQWLTAYEAGGDTSAGFALASPSPGKALLLTESFGLVNTFGAEPLFISSGDGCLFAQGVTPGGGIGPQPVGPGGSAAYEVDPGSLTLSVHAYPPGAITGEFDCTVPPVLTDIQVTLNAGERAFLLLHAPDATDLRALVVPIED